MEIVILVVFVIVVVVWLAYEIMVAPLMPDDYGLTEEENKEIKELTKKNKKNE